LNALQAISTVATQLFQDGARVLDARGRRYVQGGAYPSDRAFKDLRANSEQIVKLRQVCIARRISAHESFAETFHL
jgi:hypothetical protein